MSVFRKALSRGATQFAKNGRTASLKFSPASITQRSFSNILESRELGEEARYIRNIEAQKKAEIRANIERILALEDGHEEKAELEGLLGACTNFVFRNFIPCNSTRSLVLFSHFCTAEKKEEGGIIAKLGLNDWKFALPIGLFVGIPLISNEVSTLH